ncbi:MAG: transcription-repair coupling factor, partial [Desulfobacterales bacterium]
YGTVLVCSTQSQADRLNGLLSPYDIHPKYAENIGEIERANGQVVLCIGQLSSGFSWPMESVAVITEDEIFGAKHHRRSLSPSKSPSEAMAFEDLQNGDHIVHVEHGIGQYQGLSKLKLDGVTNDFLLIVYKGGDKLYLPVDRMGMVQKYVGVDGVEPAIDKLGGQSWDRLKKKIKKSAEKIAKELLDLYAVRKVAKGHAFQQEDSYFRDFEAGFTYDETEDQLKAIDAVLRDMKQPTSMDRLICGDVGYGKTEVALRASFVAVHDGKQVAVLVPTTVLAEQHHATFSSRFDRYPVHIACLNRFRSAAKQREILAGLASGTIDIVVGTHRLLQKDISFKDLGLVILDEEQRFGVKDKEKLKKLRHTVDVLALTATPIPRTLHMSLLGVRDISIISTPPEHRQAIITQISEFDEALIAEAIHSELNRGGQIFFLHNNIHSIGPMSRRLQQLVPRVRLGVAHGRLKEAELERVMLRFVNGEIDMLVCTTIIESGLDIPAANTILVNRADRFGLAQMYQLRGRVGRSAEQAYAYLLMPRGASIGRDAQKRMKVLMEHSNLGSGFQIAMSDLKIRGGGTILGGEQSGHIAAVGYDMFLKLMAESISELKGEPILEPLEPEINVMMSAFIPESYISDIDQRMLAYRRLARMVALEEIADFKGEIVDRFGPLPGEMSNLLLKIMLKVLAVKAGVKRLDLAGSQLMLSFSEAHLSNPSGLLDMIANENSSFEFTPDHILKTRLSAGRQGRLIEQMKKILKEIAQHVNC